VPAADQPRGAAHERGGRGGLPEANGEGGNRGAAPATLHAARILPEADGEERADQPRAGTQRGGPHQQGPQPQQPEKVPGVEDVRQCDPPPQEREAGQPFSRTCQNDDVQDRLRRREGRADAGGVAEPTQHLRVGQQAHLVHLQDLQHRGKTVVLVEERVQQRQVQEVYQEEDPRLSQDAAAPLPPASANQMRPNRKAY
jgi:hypothetical protein